MQTNTQMPLPRSWDESGKLDVHSCFHTIQGEGPFAGHAAYFVRLFGCNLQCPGCDTDYTSCALMYDASVLAHQVSTECGKGDLVVITGGEPFRQNITPFVRLLVDDGFRVQVETNGTLMDVAELPSEATVVVSPKTARINPRLARRANAYKYVLRAGDVADDGLPTIALGYTQAFPVRSYGESATGVAHVARPPEGWDGPIYLQPMDEQDEARNEANMRACVDSVVRHKRYILGVQMHKYLQLP